MWFFSCSRSCQIAVYVIAAHFFVLCVGCFQYVLQDAPLRSAMVIRTTVYPKLEKFGLLSKGTVQLPAVSHDKGFLEKGKQDHLSVTSKPAIVKKGGANIAKNKAIDASILEKIACGLECLSVSEIPAASRVSIVLPKQVELQKDMQTELSSGVFAYKDAVALFLQRHLNLPEFGEVIVCIEIQDNGSVLCCEILEEKSRENGEYIRKILPELVFPCFNEFGLLAKRLQFTMTFRNAENALHEHR